MSIKILRFEWDGYNVEHLKQRHPAYDLELLEEIVRMAKTYKRFGVDRYGKTVYGAKRGNLTVLFNLKKNRTARIFSIHEE
ncbi:hypothetical protein HYR99_03950 [Candidatus Poribacteria bacterium]|nr:hypothetical protein [Candidatus Poribacteria bacterium]